MNHLTGITFIKATGRKLFLAFKRKFNLCQALHPILCLQEALVGRLPGRKFLFPRLDQLPCKSWDGILGISVKGQQWSTP